MYNFELNDPAFLPHADGKIKFTLLKGEILVVVGENGVGKSTMLQHFIKQFSKTSIGVVEQKPLDFFYDYSLHQIREIQKGIDIFWENFDLSNKGERRISMLSGGEAQSLKLASALASKKELYVLDEPSQALDHEKKKSLAELIENLRTQGASFLIVEHDLDWLPKNIPVIKLGNTDSTIKVVDQWTT